MAFQPSNCIYRLSKSLDILVEILNESSWLFHSDVPLHCPILGWPVRNLTWRCSADTAYGFLSSAVFSAAWLCLFGLVKRLFNLEPNPSSFDITYDISSANYEYVNITIDLTANDYDKSAETMTGNKDLSITLQQYFTTFISRHL